jgi:hypothetical protein
MSGGRPSKPTNPHGLAAIRRIKERARKRAGASLDKVVRFWIELVGDQNAHMGDRNRAAENLCDRFGFPRLEAVANMDAVLSEPPKLFDFTGHFLAPPGWNGQGVDNDPEKGTTVEAPTLPAELGPSGPDVDVAGDEAE